MSALARLLPDTVVAPLRYARYALPMRVVTALNPTRYYSDRPLDFFIVGLQKSGTQWLTALLDNHPQVNAIPPRPTHGRRTILAEGHLFDSLADPKQFRRVYFNLHGGFYRDLAFDYGRLDPGKFKARMRRRFNAFYDAQRRKQLVGDKTTEYVFHLDALDDYYPAAKKICVLRDPRDRAVSFHFQQVRKRRIEAGEIEDYEVDAYCGRVEAEYRALTTYGGPAIHVLKYEDMQVSPEPVVIGILSFLGVDTQAEIVSELVREASFETLSGRRPGEADGASHFRKGVVGDWRRSLAPEQAARMLDRLEAPTRTLAERYDLDLADYLCS